jgi:hypothetical protein
MTKERDILPFMAMPSQDSIIIGSYLLNNMKGHYAGLFYLVIY